MGVQLSEATKAARELGPEARAQLSNVVKREDLLIMLQDKADNSVMNKLSDQATRSVRTIEQLGEQVSNLLRQHAHSLITLSADRENGDAALSSRLWLSDHFFLRRRCHMISRVKPWVIGSFFCDVVATL